MCVRPCVAAFLCVFICKVQLFIVCCVGVCVLYNLVFVCSPLYIVCLL